MYTIQTFRADDNIRIMMRLKSEDYYYHRYIVIIFYYYYRYYCDCPHYSHTHTHTHTQTYRVIIYIYTLGWLFWRSEKLRRRRVDEKEWLVIGPTKIIRRRRCFFSWHGAFFCYVIIAISRYIIPENVFNFFFYSYFSIAHYIPTSIIRRVHYLLYTMCSHTHYLYTTYILW